MKKIYLLLLLVFCLSCSKDDDSSNSKISINPPEWIRGTWKNEASSSLQFQFTSNDMVQVSVGMHISYRDQLSEYAKVGAEVSVDETVSENEYEISL